jgi:glutamine amidotransferase
MGGNLVILDYGMGNLHSVSCALQYLGASHEICSSPRTVARADAIVLPGVGSFQTAMLRLNATGLADAVREAVLVRGRKVLGICLGQQLMAEFGEEEGGHAGLALLQGRVCRFPNAPGIKVPHVGFNKVNFQKGSRLFAGLGSSVDCYFVHSYRLALLERPGLTATCDYGGSFVAAYEHENFFSTQFHPEKSQTNGLKILENFLKV